LVTVAEFAADRFNPANVWLNPFKLSVAVVTVAKSTVARAEIPLFAPNVIVSCDNCICA
jgi:hypothetical protein